MMVLLAATYSDANVRSTNSARSQSEKTVTPAWTADLPKATPRTESTLSTSSAITGMSMSWSVAPGGGFVGGTSSQYGLSGATGQSVIGVGTDSDFGIGIGFFEGIETCRCDNMGDMNADGTYDSVDLNFLISALFFNGENPQDPTCTSPRSDLNCDSTSDSVDLNIIISFLFFNGNAPCNPCTNPPI